MRARLVRPEFWEDSLVGAMPDPVRLLYIGLWGVADDAGYLEWDTTALAIKLQAYQRGSVAARVKKVEELAQVLIDAGRVELLACEKHAFIPTLERHRIAGGNKSEQVKKLHEKEPSRRVRTPKDPPRPRPGNGAVRTEEDESRSESPSDSESDSLSPSPRRSARAQKSPEELRLEAIARAEQKLNDPATSDEVKKSARFALAQLGVG